MKKLFGFFILVAVFSLPLFPNTASANEPGWLGILTGGTWTAKFLPALSEGRFGKGEEAINTIGFGSQIPPYLPEGLPNFPAVGVLESVVMFFGPFSPDLLVGYRYVTNTDKSREELLKEFEEYATIQGFQIYNRSSYGALAFSSRRDGGEELTVRVGRTTEENQVVVTVRYEGPIRFTGSSNSVTQKQKKEVEQIPFVGELRFGQSKRFTGVLGIQYSRVQNWIREVMLTTTQVTPSASSKIQIDPRNPRDLIWNEARENLNIARLSAALHLNAWDIPGLRNRLVPFVGAGAFINAARGKLTRKEYQDPQLPELLEGYSFDSKYLLPDLTTTTRQYLTFSASPMILGGINIFPFGDSIFSFQGGYSREGSFVRVIGGVTVHP